jgi:hypothetical protein
MSRQTKINKTEQLGSDQAFMAGLQKHQATIPSLTIGGVPIPTTSLITILQQRTTARTTTVTSRAAWQDDVQAENATVAQSQATVAGARQAIKVMFAGQIEALADFGLKPPKARTPLTTEQKAAAKAKAEATRAARHTMSPKQKAQITGTVPAPAPSPSPEPATAPAVAPAAPAGTATSKS